MEPSWTDDTRAAPGVIDVVDSPRNHRVICDNVIRNLEQFASPSSDDPKDIIRYVITRLEAEIKEHLDECIAFTNFIGSDSRRVAENFLLCRCKARGICQLKHKLATLEEDEQEQAIAKLETEARLLY